MGASRRSRLAVVLFVGGLAGAGALADDSILPDPGEGGEDPQIYMACTEAQNNYCYSYCAVQPAPTREPGKPQLQLSDSDCERNVHWYPRWEETVTCWCVYAPVHPGDHAGGGCDGPYNCS